MSELFLHQTFVFDFEGSLLVVNELKIRYSFVYHKAAQVH